MSHFQFSIEEPAPEFRDELTHRAINLARELAEGPQVAMRMLKRSIYNAAELTFGQALDEIAGKTAVADYHMKASRKNEHRVQPLDRGAKIGRCRIDELDRAAQRPGDAFGGSMEW